MDGKGRIPDRSGLEIVYGWSPRVARASRPLGFGAKPLRAELGIRVNEMPRLNFFLTKTRDEVAASIEVSKILSLV